MKNIECEICFENHWCLNETIKCYNCKKNICYLCFSKYLNTMNNVLSYQCPYCRIFPSFSKIASMFNKLNKTLRLEDNLTISWNKKINFDIDINRYNLYISVQDIPSNLESNVINDLNIIIRDYLSNRNLI